MLTRKSKKGQSHFYSELRKVIQQRQDRTPRKQKKRRRKQYRHKRKVLKSPPTLDHPPGIRWAHERTGSIEKKHFKKRKGQVLRTKMPRESPAFGRFDRPNRRIDSCSRTAPANLQKVSYERTSKEREGGEEKGELDLRPRCRGRGRT